MAKVRSKKGKKEIQLPPAHDWRTTDEDELNKRRVRAKEEDFVIRNTDAAHPIFSNFNVRSSSGMTYSVEVRNLNPRQVSCTCVDFRINGLAACKHTEAVLMNLQARFRRLFKQAGENGSTRLEVVPDPARGTVRLETCNGSIPARLRNWFAPDGVLNGDLEEGLKQLDETRRTSLPDLRISQDTSPWIENLRRARERKELRRNYELKVQSGEWPAQETKVPLFPYQRDGMLHLAFTERALLADEMGLGKTIQAIAACALLHRLGAAKRVLVVAPASLKSEWEEQIRKFTDLPYDVVFGAHHERLSAYRRGVFFTIVNYEQMIRDTLDVNEYLAPDIVILDEAQRIKNWGTKTAQAVKRLQSRYAFVLTGTPIENRIDELHSLMDFLDPAILGPLFRFNREFYQLDDRGRPCGYQNLDKLQARVQTVMLRRRKADVETELPERTDRTHFVKLSPAQRTEYSFHESQVARLRQLAERRPLRKEEQDKLQRELAMMRMICDTNFILNPEDRVCPKLDELSKILEECEENGAKVIVFSEWERMLQLVRDHCKENGIEFAWHTGSVPQKRRRAEINLFKNDPNCRVFLTTDSGATGLNLQNASVVINCDLPWTPTRLEQRIARAWRKNQTRSVTVINLVSENTIEHKMLGTLSCKQALSDGVLDRLRDVSELKLTSGRESFLSKLDQLISTAPSKPPTPHKNLPSPDRVVAFSECAREELRDSLVRCEERYPQEGAHSVIVVVVDKQPELYREKLASIHDELLGPGQIDPLAPVRLEVIDRATDEALQRLIDAGLLQKTIRAARPLHPVADAEKQPALSDEQIAAIKSHHLSADRQLTIASALAQVHMVEESRAAASQAIRHLAAAKAIESCLPEPGSPDDAVTPPLSHCWNGELGSLREFMASKGEPSAGLLNELKALIKK